VDSSVQVLPDRESRVGSGCLTGGDDPVYFRGTACREKKLYQGTTHRVCSPEETFEKIFPVLPKAGITRLADITGLDRIGIPTILAMRPDAPTLSNSSGKGFTKIAALVSAAMEGIELFCGEEIDRVGCQVIRSSYKNLEVMGIDVPAVERLALTNHSLFDEDVEESWALGWDLIKQREVAVPFDMVGLSPVFDGSRRSGRLSFQTGSNGLASGNVFLEAVCAGLYEVIERDAVTCMNVALVQNPSVLRVVDGDTVPYDTVQELRDRLSSKGIASVLLDCTVDTKVPTYEVYLIDEEIPSTGLFKGYGSHLHPEVAILRAYTEAVQSRAVYIAGSRDDMMTVEHKSLRTRRRIELKNLAHDMSELVPIDQVSMATDTFEGDCHRLMEAVLNVGLDSVVVFDLSLPEFGVAVVRVIVPGLEGYSFFKFYKTGFRAIVAMRAATGEQ